MVNFALRNLRVYFRQKDAVFFSLLSSLIIVAVYVMFLGDVWSSSVDMLPDGDHMFTTWIIAGIIAVTSATTAMGAFGAMVEDRDRKIDKDFYAAPVSRASIIFGYFLSAYAVSVIMSLFTLLLGEIFLVITGVGLTSFAGIMKAIGFIFISSLVSSAMIFFITSLFSTLSAFSTASIIIGTLAGFLTGIYLPIGNLPSAVQWIIKIFPVSHAAVLMRDVLMKDAIEHSFEGIPQSYADEFCEEMGVFFCFGEYRMTTGMHIVVMLAGTALFLLFAYLKIAKRKIK